MSKTFESVKANRTLTVEDYHGDVLLHIEGEGASKGFRLPAETAPALALAILEAAGVESPYYNLGEAVDNLRQHVEREARHSAEAEAQAKLEAEALELMNVRLRASGTTVHLTKATVDPVALEGWLAVARRAREMRAEK